MLPFLDSAISKSVFRNIFSFFQLRLFLQGKNQAITAMSSRTPSDKEIPLDPSQEQAPTNSPAFVETQEDDDGFSTGSSVSVFDEDNELENGTRASSDVMSSSNGKDEPAIALKESRLVMLARWAAILILLGVTVAVGVGVYRYVSDQEQDDFKNSYSEQSQKVLDHVGNTFDQSLGALDNLMVSLTALHENEEDPNKDWPFVAFPNFALQAAKFMSLTGATSLHLAHRVTTGQRPQWEQFTVDNEGWIGEAWQFQEENGLNPPKNTSEVEKEDFAWQTVPYISDTSRSTVPYDLPGAYTSGMDITILDLYTCFLIKLLRIRYRTVLSLVRVFAYHQPQQHFSVQH